MSNPSASRKFMPAVWILAVAALAALGIAGSASLRTHRASTTAMQGAAAQAATAQGPAPALSAQEQGRIRESLGTLPLAFEANQGQTDPQVKYTARGNGYTVFLTANDTVFALQSSSRPASATTGKHGFAKTTATGVKTTGAKTTQAPPTKDVTADATAAIHMHLVGGNAQPQIVAGSQLPGVTNYYIGSDPSQWRTGVKQYTGVSYRNVYPGVNMAFHGEQRQLEFDFIVAAGVSPAPIHLAFSGARKIATDASGNLLLSSAAGDVVMHKPVAYQEINGQRQTVAAEFTQVSNDQVGFALGSYDRSRELVIDPSLSYSTYLGRQQRGRSVRDRARCLGQRLRHRTDEVSVIRRESQRGRLRCLCHETEFHRNGSSSTRNFCSHRRRRKLLSKRYWELLRKRDRRRRHRERIRRGQCDSRLSDAVSVSGNLWRGRHGCLRAEVEFLGNSRVFDRTWAAAADDNANAIAVDGSGNAYVAGETTSTTNFPIKNPDPVVKRRRRRVRHEARQHRDKPCLFHLSRRIRGNLATGDSFGQFQQRLCHRHHRSQMTFPPLPACSRRLRRGPTMAL